MHKIIKFIIIFLFLCLFFLDNIFADSISAISASREDVELAINTANIDDTVIIPSGSVIWNSSILIKKKLYIIGNGINNTIIKTDGCFAFSVNINEEDNQWRISNISFDGSNNLNGGGINIKGNVKGFRIDYCSFKNCRQGVSTYGYTYGVIDHCNLLDYGTGVDVADYDDDAAWLRTITFGTSNAVYIENCEFT